MLAAEIKRITDWLIDGGRSAPNPAKMMAETCERLVAAGVPLWRVGVFIRTLHPDIYGRNFIWKPGAEVEIGSVDFGIQDAPEFRSSPLAIVFREGIEVRARPDDPESKRFPIIDDMRAEGVTDYIALAADIYRRPDPCIELDHESSPAASRTSNWMACGNSL